MGFVKVAETDNMQEGEVKTFEADGKEKALIKKDGNFFALDNVCCHMGGPIGEGNLIGNEVECPWHGWRYDIKSGISSLDEDTKLATFKVKIEGKNIVVEI